MNSVTITFYPPPQSLSVGFVYNMIFLSFALNKVIFVFTCYKAGPVVKTASIPEAGKERRSERAKGNS